MLLTVRRAVVGVIGTGAVASQDNGVPPPFVGGFSAYSGVLSGTDLSKAEIRAGSEVGLTLSPVVPVTITVATTVTRLTPLATVILRRPAGLRPGASLAGCAPVTTSWSWAAGTTA